MHIPPLHPEVGSPADAGRNTIPVSPLVSYHKLQYNYGKYIAGEARWLHLAAKPPDAPHHKRNMKNKESFIKLRHMKCTNIEIIWLRFAWGISSKYLEYRILCCRQKSLCLSEASLLFLFALLTKSYILSISEITNTQTLHQISHMFV